MVWQGDAFGEKGLLEPFSPADATLKALPASEQPSAQCSIHLLPLASYRMLLEEVPDPT
jgi:hypothetical protein